MRKPMQVLTNVHVHPLAKIEGEVHTDMKRLVEVLRSQPWMTTIKSHGEPYSPAYVDLVVDGWGGVSKLVMAMEYVNCVLFQEDEDYILDDGSPRLIFDLKSRDRKKNDILRWPTFTEWRLCINCWPEDMPEMGLHPCDYILPPVPASENEGKALAGDLDDIADVFEKAFEWIESEED